MLKNCQKVLKKSVKKEKNFECMVCKKKYSTRQGLWYHRAKNNQCNYEKNDTSGKSVKKKKFMQSENNSKIVKDEEELNFLKNEDLKDSLTKLIKAYKNKYD